MGLPMGLQLRERVTPLLRHDDMTDDCGKLQRERRGGGDLQRRDGGYLARCRHLGESSIIDMIMPADDNDVVFQNLKI